MLTINIMKVAMNYFISQFGNPRGKIGRFLSKIMNISNKKMYKANMSKIKNGMKILEIGFGNGKQLQMIKKTYPDAILYGIDISKDMYCIAEQRLENNAKLYIADAECLPFDDACFDAVITTDTFYFWNEPEKVLSEIKRTLKSRGIFVNAFNTMYASSVGKARKGDGIYQECTLVETARRLDLKLIGRKKIGLCKRLNIFRKGDNDG